MSRVARLTGWLEQLPRRPDTCPADPDPPTHYWAPLSSRDYPDSIHSKVIRPFIWDLCSEGEILEERCLPATAVNRAEEDRAHMRENAGNL